MRTREKQTNFIDLFKAFWMPDEVESSIDEAIAKTAGLTAEEKQLLIGSSQRTKQLERDLQTHEIEKRPKKARANFNSKSTKQNIKEHLEYKEENIEREER